MGQSMLMIGLAMILLAVASVVLTLIVVVMQEGRARHRDLERLQGGLSGVVKGGSLVQQDGLRDPRVAKGFVYDKRSKTFEGQGKLSDEYVAALIGR